LGGGPVTWRAIDGWSHVLGMVPFARRAWAPDLILSCGSRGERRAARLHAACRRRCVWAHIEVPLSEVAPDLVFVSAHDWSPEFDQRPSYRRMLGVPHRVAATKIAASREGARRRFAPEGGKLATCLIGGPNPAYDFDPETMDRITSAVRTLSGEGWRCLISTSRRTPAELHGRLMLIESPNVLVWDKKGENPYIEFLAAADAFLVTEDSITMTCEAIATGKPVYSVPLAGTPGPRLEKFQRFHATLRDHLQVTRPFHGLLDAYFYTPFDDAENVAREILSLLQSDLARGDGMDRVS
jgi:mitochondrial fission protein ELM1